MSLTPEDIDEIANKLVEKVQEKNQNFWIEPEKHYQDHQAMREIVRDWRSAKSIFAKAFFGLVVVGVITLAFFGFAGKIK